MLPLFFAAMVWPARRTLAIRAIETLIALILSKFAIVAVLSLGGSALGHSTIPGAASVLTGGTLVLLAAFTPWALLRMLPLHEVASAAAGGLSHAPKTDALDRRPTRGWSSPTARSRSEPARRDAERCPRQSHRSSAATPAPPDGPAAARVPSSTPSPAGPSRSTRTSPSQSTRTSPSRSPARWPGRRASDDRDRHRPGLGSPDVHPAGGCHPVRRAATPADRPPVSPARTPARPSAGRTRSPFPTGSAATIRSYRWATTCWSLPTSGRRFRQPPTARTRRPPERRTHHRRCSNHRCRRRPTRSTRGRLTAAVPKRDRRASSPGAQGRAATRARIRSVRRGRVMSDRLTYSFGPLERRGIAGGVAAGQLAVLGAGALLAILVLDHAPSAGGAMLATIICAVAAATAFAPLGGRTVHEWLPIAARFIVAKMLGDGRFVTTEPTAGTVAGTGTGAAAATTPPPDRTAAAARRRSHERTRRPSTDRASPPANAWRRRPGPAHAAAAARRQAARRRLSRSADRGPDRAFGPARHGRSGVPGRLVLAAGSRGAGTPAGPLGAGAVRRGRRPDPAAAVDRTNRPGTG